MRVLIFGSREWDNEHAIRLILEGVQHLYPDEEITVVHGAARGADRLGGQVAAELGLRVEVFPADWARHGKRAGHLRNQQMLDSGIDLAFGFKHRFDWSLRRGGTEDMARRLRDAGVPFEIIPRREGALL